MRSFTQFESKIALGGAAVERNTRLSADTAAAWRFLYGLFQEGKLREWYDAQEIRRGDAVRDTRLRDYFEDSRPALGPSSRSEPV